MKRNATIQSFFLPASKKRNVSGLVLLVLLVLLVGGELSVARAGGGGIKGHRGVGGHWLGSFLDCRGPHNLFFFFGGGGGVLVSGLF